MKVLVKTGQLMLAFAAVAMFTACNSKNNDSAQQSNVAPITTDANGMINIRYIDTDSVLNNYNLAKDLQAVMLRTQENYSNVERQKGAELQKFAAAIQNNLKTNNYLSEASAQADQQKFQKMQADAEASLAQLQQEIQNELVQNNIQLNDSINNFIKIYNAQKKYDMIIKKEATIFIDPKYDITKEVIDGLNSRYTKSVKK